MIVKLSKLSFFYYLDYITDYRGRVHPPFLIQDGALPVISGFINHDNQSPLALVISTINHS